MLTLLDRINQKLPQASESVLAQVWTILNVSESASEDEELDAEFERWEAASDEDEAQIETMLSTKGG
jgi:ferric-dicitrate binding protein FerR (iron transport regulator)